MLARFDVNVDVNPAPNANCNAMTMYMRTKRLKRRDRHTVDDFYTCTKSDPETFRSPAPTFRESAKLDGRHKANDSSILFAFAAIQTTAW